MKIRFLSREQRGESLIEFAVSAIVVLIFLFGIIDFGRAMYIYHFVSYSAQEAARYAMVRGATWKTPCSGTGSTGSNIGCEAAGSDVVSYVQSLATPGVSTDTSVLTITPTWTGTSGGSSGATCANTSTKNNDHNAGCQVKVQVSYKFTFMLPFMPSTSPTLSATSVQVIQE